MRGSRLRPVRQVHRLSLLLMAFSLLSVPATATESAPLYARLLARLNAKALVDGSPFFVKTMDAWTDGRCSLKRGTLLEGRAVHVEHRAGSVKQERIALQFLPILCAGDEVHQFVPLLAAVESSGTVFEDSLVQEALIHSFAMSEGAHATLMHGGGAPPKADIRVPSDHSEAAYVPASVGSPLRIGEVRGFGKVVLTLPHYLSDPTVLTSSHPLVFDADSRFAMVIRPLLNAPAPETASAPAQPSLPPAEGASAAPVPAASFPAALPPDTSEADVCVASGCALADEATRTGAHLALNVPLRTLGYRERSSRVLTSLAEDAAIAFLGDDQLLVTFDAHPLVLRSKPESDRLRHPRIITAVVISTRTGRAMHHEEWRVPESGPYLWPLDNGRVLARVGDAVRIYRRGLVVDRQWNPAGDLDFLRISPSRRVIAAVTERERHTPEQHRRLEAFLGTFHPVEEDEELTLLDGDLHVLSTSPVDGAVPPPAVLDSGLVFSERGAGDKWKLYQIDWNRARLPIRGFVSSCPLRIETLPANLILLGGCATGVARYWYRIVQPDGKVLLRGTHSSTDLIENVEAPPDGRVFAIGIAHATRAVDFSLGMSASDFTSIGVSVYRSSDGHLVYAARSGSSAVNRQSFAVSDSGSQLAILSGESLSLYGVSDAPAAVAAVHSSR